MHSNVDIEGLFEALLMDCCTDLPKKGKLYLRNRLKNEGIGFLTVTLPSLGSAVLTALEKGCFVCPTAFESKDNSALPKFLTEGLLGKIFCRNGSVKPDYCSDTLRKVVQFCMYMRKVVLPPTKKVIRKATRDFITRNKTTGPKSAEVVAAMRTLVLELNSQIAFPSVFSALLAHPPRHTNGAVALKSKLFIGDNDEPQPVWKYRRSVDSYTYMSEMADVKDYMGVMPGVPPRLVEPYKVCEYAAVPKTATSVRIIGTMEADMIYNRVSLDQALRDYLVVATKSIQFKDQTINQKKAYRGSMSRNWSTIDSSAASDGNSLELVVSVLGGFGLFDRLINTRPTTVRISEKFWREDIELPLNIYSTMGDQNCFGLLSFMMFLSATAGVMLKRGWKPEEALNWAKHGLTIYGDDVCVQSRQAEAALYGINGAGFSTNVEKSCLRTTPAYAIRRESCGVDYVDGVDITPVYLRVTGVVQRTKKGLRLRLRDDLRDTPRSKGGDVSILKAERHARQCHASNLANLTQFWYDQLSCLWTRTVVNGKVVEIRPPATASSHHLGVCTGEMPEPFLLGRKIPTGTIRRNAFEITSKGQLSGILYREDGITTAEMHLSDPLRCTSTMVRNDYGLNWFEGPTRHRKAMRVFVPINEKEEDEIDPLVGLRTRLLSVDDPEQEYRFLDLDAVAIPHGTVLRERRISLLRLA